MMLRRFSLVTVLITAVTVTGCGGTDAPKASGPKLPDTVFTAVPAGTPTPIAQIKQQAKGGDDVVVRVRVGGTKRPYVDGRAVMTVVDATLPQSCGVKKDDPCDTPWDYCCSDPAELKASTATVQIVDADGKPLKADLAGDDRVQKLGTLVIQGKVAPRTDAESLVIQAHSVSVEK